MKERRPDPRVGLLLLVRHLNELVKYFEEGRLNARGMIQEHSHFCHIKPDVPAEYAVNFFRYYGAVEVFDTTIAELQRTIEFAAAPFPRPRGEPTVKDATQRLYEVLTRLTERVLNVSEAELKTRCTYLRGLHSCDTSELDAEITERIKLAIAAESSQRIVALETVSTALRAVVTTFLERFPTNPK